MTQKNNEENKTGDKKKETKEIKDQIIEQVNNFKYLGCNLSIFNLNQDNNIIKYNAINGCINRYLGNSMRKEVILRLHNIVLKPMLLYSSET